MGKNKITRRQKDICRLIKEKRQMDKYKLKAYQKGNPQKAS